MKRILIIAGLITVPLIVFAQAQSTGNFISPGQDFSVETTSMRWDAATPISIDGGTLQDNTQGANLAGAFGYNLVLSTNHSGLEIVSCKLLCYQYAIVNVQNGVATWRWMRCPTNLDVTLATLQRDIPTNDFAPTVGSERIAFIPQACDYAVAADAGIWLQADGGLQNDGVTVTIGVRRRR